MTAGIVIPDLSEYALGRASSGESAASTPICGRSPFWRTTWRTSRCSVSTPWRGLGVTEDGRPARCISAHLLPPTRKTSPTGLSPTTSNAFRLPSAGLRRVPRGGDGRGNRLARWPFGGARTARSWSACPRLPGTTWNMSCANPGTCRARGHHDGAGSGLRVMIAPGEESFDDGVGRPATAGPGRSVWRPARPRPARLLDLSVRRCRRRSPSGHRPRDPRSRPAAFDRPPAPARPTARRTAAPVFVHHPLVLKPSGEKLSKSSGDTGVRELRAAGTTPGAGPRPGGPRLWAANLGSSDSPPGSWVRCSKTERRSAIGDRRSAIHRRIGARRFVRRAWSAAHVHCAVAAASG